MEQRVTKKRFAAAILAGGRARRLGGIAKGNIEIRSNVTIIQHLLSEIRQAAIEKTVIVANDAKPYLSYGVEIIADHQQNIGPLAGIVSALRHYQKRCEAVLIMPCDTPCITHREINVLQEAYLTSNSSIVYVAVVTAVAAAFTDVVDEQSPLHPLCAIVSCSVVDELERAIADGIHKVRLAWEKLGATPVYFAKASAFVNINSYADLCKIFGK